jgi:hypothetical protein
LVYQDAGALGGRLYYDVDGNDPTNAKVMIAAFAAFNGSAPTLLASDITVV